MESKNEITHKSSRNDRALGCLLGVAIGNALVATLGFMARNGQPIVRDLIGGGPFDLAPGQWTDDTSIALCLADSLIACGGLNTTDLMQRFLRWFHEGDNSVTGRCFDIGLTTRNALAFFEQTGRFIGDAVEDDQQAGNGSLMRLAPIAIWAAPDASRAAELARAQSRTTHAAPAAHDACALFAVMLVEAIISADRESVLAPRAFVGRPEIVDIAAGCWRMKSRAEISSSGYVVHTLEAALWCVAHSDSFEEAVILAANLADDSDTVAAVTGQLAGALFGKDAIPIRWRSKVAWFDRLED